MTNRQNSLTKHFARLSYFLAVIFGIAIIVFTALLVYWTAEYGNASRLKSEGATVEASIGEKAKDLTWRIGSLRDGINSTRLTTLVYEVGGNSYQADSFVVSPEVGQKVLAYYDLNNAENIATEADTTEAGAQVIMVGIGLLVATGLLIYTTVILRRASRKPQNSPQTVIMSLVEQAKKDKK